MTLFSAPFPQRYCIREPSLRGLSLTGVHSQVFNFISSIYTALLTTEIDEADRPFSYILEAFSISSAGILRLR